MPSPFRLRTEKLHFFPKFLPHMYFQPGSAKDFRHAGRKLSGYAGAVNYPQACFKCIFQKIGKNQPHISTFVNRESGRQIKPQRKWNVFPRLARIVVPCYTVRVPRFSHTNAYQNRGFCRDGASKIFFEFWKILFFCQSGNLVQVVAHIMPRLSHFFNGSFKFSLSSPLHG